MNTSQNYRSNLDALYSVSKKISILDSAKPASTERTMALEKMLEKILLHDHSILLLLHTLPEQIQELDVSLIASAARNIMETANFFFYLSERGLDRDEMAFRIEIMTLNTIYNEIDITQKLDFSQQCFHLRVNHLYYKTAKERFQKSAFFQNLTPQEQAQALSGRKAVFKAGSPHILSPQIESAVYNLLSNSLHSLPLGLCNNSVNHTPASTNFFQTEHLLTISLQISCIYTAWVVKDYLDLRKHLYSLLSTEEKELIKSLKSTKDLEEYIQSLRKEYEKDLYE